MIYSQGQPFITSKTKKQSKQNKLFSFIKSCTFPIGNQLIFLMKKTAQALAHAAFPSEAPIKHSARQFFLARKIDNPEIIPTATICPPVLNQSAQPNNSRNQRFTACSSSAHSPLCLSSKQSSHRVIRTLRSLITLVHYTYIYKYTGSR